MLLVCSSFANICKYLLKIKEIGVVVMAASDMLLLVSAALGDLLVTSLLLVSAAQGELLVAWLILVPAALLFLFFIVAIRLLCLGGRLCDCCT